jgi:hypothetical protein
VSTTNWGRRKPASPGRIVEREAEGIALGDDAAGRRRRECAVQMSVSASQ